MNEEDYIKLNDLLTKYRVVLLKEFLENNIDSRDKISKQIRSVDNLRANMFLDLNTRIQKTKEFKEAPICTVKGHGGSIEMAQMAKTLIDVAEQIKEQFPETRMSIPILNKHGGMKTTYKKVESWEELK